MTVQLIFLVLIALLSVSGRASVASEILFRRSSPPSGWGLGSRCPSTASVNFLLALKQQNLDALESKFWSVSDPTSSNYRQFMSIDDIAALIAPRTEDVSVVTNWLAMNGVTAHQIVSYGDALEVSVTAAVAERLFETEFYEFFHEQSGKTIIRQWGEYSVPSAVRSCIDLVSGLSNFPISHYSIQAERFGEQNSSASGAATDLEVVSQTVASLYNIPAQSQAQGASSQGVIQFDGESFTAHDLQQYAQLLGIAITPLTADHIIGELGYYGGMEATLDIEFIASVNNAATNWFWVEDGSTWLYGFATHFFNTTNVPQVISISYGLWEGQQCTLDSDSCKQLGVNDDGYVSRVNIEFQKLGLRGITIIVSSGDSGAHTRSDKTCTAKTLRADFPASSPFVTSVGATQITNAVPLDVQPAICTQFGTKCAANGTEVAVSYSVAKFASGGGFSEVSDQPSYQTSVVQKYLTSGVALPPASMYNSSRRAHPDVSAVGHNNLVLNGYLMAMGGTSASAPIFAAVASMLNAASMANTGKPLGFLNPLLYQIYAQQPDAFNDITVGDNKCTEGGCGANCQGWTATKGWDPVTGLGTPNVAKLLNFVNMQLQSKAAELIREDTIQLRE